MRSTLTVVALALVRPPGPAVAEGRDPLGQVFSLAYPEYASVAEEVARLDEGDRIEVLGSLDRGKGASKFLFVLEGIEKKPRRPAT